MGKPELISCDLAVVTKILMNVNTFLRQGESLVVLAGAVQCMGEIAHRRGEVTQYRHGLSVVGRVQKLFPGPTSSFLHQRLPEADGLPQDGDGLWGSACIVLHPAQHAGRHRQLNCGIELSRMAEALDEGLKLIHRASGIALHEAGPGMPPIVSGSFFCEALSLQ